MRDEINASYFEDLIEKLKIDIKLSVSIKESTVWRIVWTIQRYRTISNTIFEIDYFAINSIVRRDKDIYQYDAYPRNSFADMCWLAFVFKV